MARKTLTIFSLIGLLLSVGLWGGNLFSARTYRSNQWPRRMGFIVEARFCRTLQDSRLAGRHWTFRCRERGSLHRDGVHDRLRLQRIHRLFNQLVAFLLPWRWSFICARSCLDVFCAILRRADSTVFPPPQTPQARAVREMRIQSQGLN